MKNIAVLVVVLLVLAACNTKEEAGSSEKAERAGVEAGSAALEAYMLTDDVDDYGYLQAILKIKNNGDKAVLINEGDFILYDTATDMEFDNVLFSMGDDGKPTDVAVLPNEEKHVVGSFIISSEKPGVTSIDLEDYEIHYMGDAPVEEDSVAVQLDLDNEYPGILVHSEVTSISSTPVESEDWAAYEGLMISVYGPLDDGEAGVRVENTSNSNISFDPSGLYIYDAKIGTQYGVDPSVKDAAFGHAMTLKPGQIVDYREAFLLENNAVQERSKIEENFFIVMYAPKNPEVPYAYGDYYHDDNLTAD